MINTWQVYPEHCNPIDLNGKLVCHGATLLQSIDRNAAIFCKSMLKNGQIALTVGLDKVQFYRGPLLGEILTTKCSLESLGKSRITVRTEITDEKDKKVLDGLVSFCSFVKTETGFSLEEHEL